MALTRAQRIDRILKYYDRDVLAYKLDVTLPEGTDPTPILRDALRDLEPRRIQRLVVPALTDDEVKELSEVSSNRLVRPHRADWEAAALGEMTEVERERAAVKQTTAANKAAPSIQQVAKLYVAPVLEPVITPEGDVTMRVRKKFVVGSDGRPKEVPITKADDEL